LKRMLATEFRKLIEKLGETNTEFILIQIIDKIIIIKLNCIKNSVD